MIQPIECNFVRFAIALMASLGLIALAGCGAATAKHDSATLTFNRDIAPIVFDHCSSCHRADGPAPFPLLTYAQVKDRGPQIVQVTKSRFMPPWLPRGGDYRFSGDCSLSDAQIATIQNWVAAGSIQGDLADLPDPPEPRLMGKPDLVVEMPATYTLPADGTDVWRKFVIAVPLTTARYVRAVEIHPNNKKVVHHAIVHIDSSGLARSIASKSPDFGIDGMVPTANEHSPAGHFLNWLPGMVPFADDPEMAWRIEPGTDLVIDAHMLPSGKPEPVRISVALYFTNTPPSKFPVDLLLHSESIDIPAGSKDFTATNSYVLPQDLVLLGLYPHAHLLGNDVAVWAVLPGGKKKTLLQIPRWDFNWQNAYRFDSPISLPRGTTLAMRIGYDNSTDNVRNPNNPPRRVEFGYHTYDEMAQVNIDVLPRNAEAAQELLDDFRKDDLQGMIKTYEFQLKRHPEDASIHTQLGKNLAYSGRLADGLEHLRRAVELEPKNAEPHYYLGRFQAAGQPDAARQEYEAAIQADPNYYQALSELGLWHLQKGHFETAEDLFTRSLKIHPNDAVLLNNLGILKFQQNNRPEALRQFRKAIAIDPNYAPAQENLRKLEAAKTD